MWTNGRGRRSIRLKGFDYSQPGAYFVTLVTLWREPLFGEIEAGELRPTPLGLLVQECWQAIPAHFPLAEVDAFSLMPNHLHGVIRQLENGPSGREALGHDAIPGRGTMNFRRGTIHRTRRVYRAPTTDRASTETIERFAQPTRGTLPTIIRTFKAAVTRRAGRELDLANIWQKNYYEHVIRGQSEYERIAAYIAANPEHWAEDAENPQNIRE